MFISMIVLECFENLRYDYLEFTDSNGTKRRFDGDVDSDNWPLAVNIISGNPLTFEFHSDGSTSDWGYKFKASAHAYVFLSFLSYWLSSSTLKFKRCIAEFQVMFHCGAPFCKKVML